MSRKQPRMLFDVKFIDVKINPDNTLYLYVPDWKEFLSQAIEGGAFSKEEIERFLKEV